MSTKPIVKNSYDPAEEEDDSGSGSGARVPEDIVPPFTMLVDETQEMEDNRRQLEQEGEKKFAKVVARDRDAYQVGDEPGMENSIKQHPLLQSQQYDGVDPSLNPAPTGNPTALAEFNNERQKQEMEKQLRLGNQPKFSNTPKPNPP